MARPPLILLLGMHRSGTSLLGSLLKALGVGMPGQLLQGDQHNPEGYFERDDVTELQEQLLRELGRTWTSASGCLPLPPNWLALPSTQRVEAALQALLNAEATRQSGAWAIKDPRCSLLLPLWRRVCADLQIPLRLIASVRDPAEVMVSLLRRDAESTGMTPWRTQQLWWHHNRRLLLDATGLPLMIVNYGAWFTPAAAEQQLSQLARFCQQADRNTPSANPSAELLTRARNQIQPQHRRSQQPQHQLPRPIHRRLRQLHRRLNQLAGQADPGNTGTRRGLVAWLQPPQQASLPAIPNGNGSLRSRLIRQRAQLVPHRDPGAWFDPVHYRQQLPGLAPDHDPLCHYWWRGWRDDRSPHPLFDPQHYRQACRERGIALQGPPLLHFLSDGLQQGIPPHPLAQPGWAAQAPQRWLLWEAAQLEGLHPWGAAALSLSNDDLPAALQRLALWQQQGLNADDLQAVGDAAAGSFAVTTALLPETTTITEPSRLCPIGAGLNDWSLHAWLQHLPCGNSFPWLGSGDAEPLIVVIGPLPGGRESLQLLDWAQRRQVWASTAESLVQLRRLGVPAQRLDPCSAGNGWLEQAGDATAASEQLGAPPLAPLHPGILTLGSAGPDWERTLTPPIWGWPGFDALRVNDAEQARVLAAWLNRCCRAGIQLVRLTTDRAESQGAGWAALAAPADADRDPNWLPPQLFSPPLHPEELQRELLWRAAGCPLPPPVHTPRPTSSTLWHHKQHGTPATAAVCISLYNYGRCIEAALDSVAAQSQGNLELIVVDDHSSDDGAHRCQRWLNQHGHRFQRALLLRHTRNSGLAAARNTAFQASRAPWCFVLDADNTLAPDALRCCLSIANAAPGSTAVVHPLIERICQDNAPDASGEALISGVSWQREALRHGNVIDAMALIRHEAWRRVGGYSHISHGWEDFDFWCKLMDDGWHGVLCPQRLATYNVHGASMLAHHTHRHLRAVSRLLQMRHSWLDLPFAAIG
jgi:GT2 family glycosyltransferase